MNILVVDDIPDVIEGIREGVSWSALEIDRVFTACSAAAARKLLEENPIDILLCDIEMPEETGLELLAWIRSRGFPLECIFLTSHAEFDYAQEALRLGSIDYILQPAPYKEIERVLRKTIQKVSSDRQLNTLKKLQDSTPNAPNHIASQHFLNMLEESVGPEETFLRIFSLLYPQKPVWDHFTLSIIQILQQKESLTFDLLPQYLSEGLLSLSGKDTAFILLREHGDRFFLLMHTDGSSQHIENILRLWYDRESSADLLKAALYIGNDITPADFYRESHNLLAFSQNNILFTEGIYLFSDIMEEDDNNYPLSLHTERWEYYLENDQGSEVADSIRNYFSQNPSACNNLRILQTIFWKLNAVLVSLTAHHELDYHQFFNGDTLTFDQYLESCRNYNDFMQMLDKLISILQTTLSNPHSRQDEDITRQIIKYIDHHLNDNLTRKELAAYVHLNEDYMAKLFKKETGVQLKEYILTRKIEMAKELLRTSNLSVSLIAVKVGFTNFSHFSYTFKKLENMSPNEYRTLHGK